MRMFYGGAEAPTLRRRLAVAGATRYSVSFWHLRDRLPKSREFPFDERFPRGAEVLLDSGGFTANKNRDNDQYDAGFWEEYLGEFIDLVGANIEALHLVTEFDHLDLGVDQLWDLRHDVWHRLPPEKFLPVWHVEHGFDELVRLAETFAQLAVTREGLRDYGHRIPALIKRYGVRVHGLAVSSLEVAASAGLASVSSSGWTSGKRHGDRVVWAHGKLLRYGKDHVERGIEEHAAHLEREGFDLELLRAGDPGEVTKLTVWSYESWADFVSRVGFAGLPSEGVTTSSPEPEPPSVEPDAEKVATSPAEPGTSLVPEGEGRKLLPLVGFVQRRTHDEHGEPVVGPPEMRTSGTSARKCDTCYIKHLCPEATPGADCAFDIPVEIKSKEQLSAMLTGMLEIQTQRALFARYAEDLEGGYPSEKVSAELDRLVKMTHLVKEIQDNRDFMEIHVKARGGAGVLSRLFGEDAGRQARELERPIGPEATDALMAEVIDAEVE